MSLLLGTDIDPTFATRDLVRALHRTPRHVVLLLVAGEARPPDASGGRLVPVTRTAGRRRDRTIASRPIAPA